MRRVKIVISLLFTIGKGVTHRKASSHYARALSSSDNRWDGLIHHLGIADSAIGQIMVPLALAVMGGFCYALHTRSSALPWLAYLSTIPWLLLVNTAGLRYRTPAFLVMTYIMLLVSSGWLYAFNVTAWLLAPLLYCPLFLLLLFQVRLVRWAWPQFTIHFRGLID